MTKKVKLYITGWRDSHMLPEGFVTAPEQDDPIAEMVARLDLALAMIESLGYHVEFAETPGDALGEEPENGYISLEGGSNA